MTEERLPDEQPYLRGWAQPYLRWWVPVLAPAAVRILDLVGDALVAVLLSRPLSAGGGRTAAGPRAGRLRRSALDSDSPRREVVHELRRAIRRRHGCC